MPAPAERAEAKALGLSRYYTGQPCKRGHIAERYTASAGCVACVRKAVLEQAAEKRQQKRQRLERPAHRSGTKAPVARPDTGDISLVAHEGTHLAAQAFEWVDQQAARLGVTPDFITDGIRNGWTLAEIERMPREDVEQLADNVRKRLLEDGATPWDLTHDSVW